MATELLFSESVNIIIIYSSLLPCSGQNNHTVLQKLTNKHNLYMKVTSN